MVKIAFDIGGALSKYPDIFRPLIKTILHCSIDVKVAYISDMHPQENIEDWLKLNDFPFTKCMVHSADYAAHGELCKSVVCKEHGIDMLIDDHGGYVSVPGKPLVRLLVMPDPYLPYYHDSWKTDGSEGDFGRRRKNSL